MARTIHTAESEQSKKTKSAVGYPKSRKSPKFAGVVKGKTLEKRIAPQDSFTAQAGLQKSKFKPGMKAIKEIMEQQASTKFGIPRLPFKRLVREIAQNFASESLRFQEDAFDALQTITEDYFVRLFECSLELALHAGRVTVRPNDFQLVRKIWDKKW